MVQQARPIIQPTERPLAIVTGASGGFGLEYARLLAEDGYDLILVARDQAALERHGTELQRRHNIRVRIVPVDLSYVENVDKVVKAVQGQPVDVLINNAGIGNYGLFDQTDWDTEQTMIELNVIALTMLTKRLLPAMVERHYGRILNVASEAAYIPGPYMAVYFATKAYVLSFSEALASELEGTGVSVTVQCPGPSATGFKVSAGLQRARTFNGHLPSASDVASLGYHSMKEGKVVVLPNWRHNIMVKFISLVPRKLLLDQIKKRQAPM